MAGNVPQRDLASSASSKLAGEWTACAFSSQFGRVKLADASSRVESLDPLLQIRLLLSGLYLSQPNSPEVRAELQRLAGHARKQEDEWLRIIGLTVGDFSGTLDTQALLQESVVVRDSIASIEHQLEQAAPQPGFRPLEDAYLNSSVAEGLRGFPARAPSHKHFQLRARPGVKPEGLDTAAGSSRAASEDMSRMETLIHSPSARPDPLHSPSRKMSASIPGKASLNVDVSSVFRTSRPDFKASALPQADKKLENRDVKTKQLGVETVVELNQRLRHPKKEVQAEEGPPADPLPSEAFRDAKLDEEMSYVDIADDRPPQETALAEAQLSLANAASEGRQDPDEDGEISEDELDVAPAQKRLRAEDAPS
ncbi:hypothetical protein WJX74_004158 [Apatococcus lobatus]|uniref:Uncharacterized protein n=2 Tax=Apatococcus TaxID=904362 RepID=A0AAW1T4S5_9CHLO